MYIYIYIYCIYLTVDYRHTKDTETLLQSEARFPPEPRSPKSETLICQKNLVGRPRVHVQRDSCSSTAPCVLKKGDGPRWPGRSCQWGCDLFKKSIVGKDGEHQIGCECLSLADQEHTACFFSNQTERENNVQYHSYNVQSNRTIRTEAMCRRHLRNLADETKRYFFFFFSITLAQRIRILFF